MTKIKKLLSLAGVLCFSLQASTAQAVGFRAFGNLGYDSFTVSTADGDSLTPAHGFSGWGLGAVGQISFLRVAPVVGLVGGVRMNYSSLSYISAKVGENTHEYRLSPVAFGFEGGAEFLALPLINLQAVLAYDIGMGGDFSSRQTVLGAQVNRIYSLESLGRFSLIGRASYSVLPTLFVGMEPSWHFTSFSYNDDRLRKRSGSGVGLKGHVGFQF